MTGSGGLGGSPKIFAKAKDARSPVVSLLGALTFFTVEPGRPFFQLLGAQELRFFKGLQPWSPEPLWDPVICLVSAV